MGKPSLYVVVRASYKEYEADLARVRGITREQGEAISNALNNSISPKQAIKGFESLSVNIQKAVGAANAFNVKPQIKGLEEMARLTGVSTARMNDLSQAMLKTARENALETAFKKLDRQLGLTTAGMIGLRREAGDTAGALKTAFGALGTRSQSAIVAEMKDIVAAFREVKSNASSTASDVRRSEEAMRTSLKKLSAEAKAVKIAPTVELTPLQQAFAMVQKQANLSGKEIDGLANKAAAFGRKQEMQNALQTIQRETNMSAIGMAKLRYEMGDTVGAIKTLGRAAVPVVGTITAVSAGLLYMGKSCLDAQLAMNRLEIAYKSIFAAGAVGQLQAIYEQTQSVGLEFRSTAEAAKSLFAASQGTTLAGDIQSTFAAVTNAAGALQLTSQQTERIFAALGQMVSKGKVQAEEMRQQLGEQLPGAFQLAAKAMGMTTSELDKFMADGKLVVEDFIPKFTDALNNQYAKAAKDAANSVQGSINRMSTEWERFRAGMLSEEPVVFTVQIVTEYLKKYNDETARKKEVLDLSKQLREQGIAPYYSKVTDALSWIWDGKQKSYSDEQLDWQRSVNADMELEALSMQQQAKEKERLSAKNSATITAALKNTNYQKKLDLVAQNKEDSAAFEQKRLEINSENGIRDIKERQKALADLDEQQTAVNKKYEQDLESLANKGSGAATRAEKAQNAYTAAVEATRAEIAGYQQQLALDSTEDLARAKIKIESEYQQAVAKTTKEIANQVASKALSGSEAQNLTALKMQSLELEKQVKFRDAEEKARDRAIQMVGDQLNFYKELSEMSGQYGNQLDMQVKLIELQASKYEDVLKIPKELVEQWKKYKLLQESYDPWDGAYRGLVKFTAEYNNEAKQWENITYSWATGFNDTTKEMWGDFLDTGKVSFDQMSLSFTKLLKDMSYQALVQPIVLSIVGMAQNSIYSATSAGQSGGGSSGSSNVYGMASGMAQQYATNKLMSGATSAFGDTINGWAASAFPNTFAPTAGAAYATPEAAWYAEHYGLSASTQMGPNTTFTGALSNFTPGFIGAGIGTLASPYFNNLVGLQNNSGSQTGAMVGGLGSAAVLGTLAAANIWNPGGWVLGGLAGLSAIAGGSIGSLFGGGGSEPGLWLDSTTILSGDVSRDTMEGWSQPNKGRSGFADAGGMGYYTQARARNGMDASAATSSAQYLAQLSQQAIALSASVKSQLESIDTTLGGSYAGEIAKNPRVYVSGNGEGGDTPSAEALGQQLLNQTYARITEAVGRMDLSKLAVAADGMVSNTMDEVEDSITKAMSVVGIGNSMGDYATKYTDAVGGKILDALNSMDLSSLSGRLTVDKTSLSGWSSAYVAIQAFDNVQTAIDSILEPTNEMFTAMNAANKQMNSWIDTLEQLGWQEAAIQDVEEKRYAYLQRYSDSLARGAEQGLYLRGMSLTSGSDSWAYQSQALRYQQENELRSAETKYGQYSTIYTSLLATQQAESTQAEISFLRKQYDSLLQEQISSAQSLVNSFDRVVDSLDEARRNIWNSDANISTSRLSDARADFSTVYAKAMAGDADAMAELPSISTNLLNLGKEQIASRDVYQDLFYDVDAKLKSAQGIASNQYNAATSQVNLLKSQLSAQDQTNMTLSEVGSENWTVS